MNHVVKFYRKTMIDAACALTKLREISRAIVTENALRRRTIKDLGWPTNCDTRRILELSKGDRNGIGSCEKCCSGPRRVCGRLRLARRLQRFEENWICCHDRPESNLLAGR